MLFKNLRLHAFFPITVYKKNDLENENEIATYYFDAVLRSLRAFSWQALSVQNQDLVTAHLKARFPLYARPQLAQLGVSHALQ